jgi:nucleotide-binding universal stress UspA family protein
MFNKALIALDLSPAEQPILECLPALREWGIRQVVLTHVIQVGYIEGAALARRQDYGDWLEKCAGPLRDAGLSVEVQVRAGGVPADEILALASETAVDLIVIGSRGQNVLSRLFLGSVARAVIRRSTVPLLLEWIEPSEVATAARCEAVCEDTLRHVLLATDFSRRSEAAEQAAIALAPRARRVECVHVIASDEDPKTPVSPGTAQAALSALVQRIEAAGGRGSATLLEGDAPAEIARYAASQDASLIVVGTHGQSWVSSIVVGSTASRLCEIAGRPVLLVP